MACNSYSNGSNPQVVFAMGTLPEGFCPATYQAMFNAIAVYLQGSLPTDFSTFLIKDSEPDPTDRDKLWVQVNPVNCDPVGFYLYNTGYAAWLPVSNTVWNGDAAGTANALTVTFSPTLKYLSDGHLFIVKAAATVNNGAVTLTPLNLGTKDVTKQGGQPLTGGEIAPNALLLLTYRNGTDDFELLNPSPAQAEITPINRIINGSFETDRDNDGVPDGWTFTGPAAGSISTTVVGHGARSYSINGALNKTGTIAMTDLQPCKGNDLYTDGEMMVLNFWHYVTVAANDDSVTVEWYDKAGASLGAAATIWNWNTAAVANQWHRVYASMVPATGARFFKLRFIGNTTGGGTGVSYFDGIAVDTVTFKRKCEFHYSGAASVARYAWQAPSGTTMVRVTAVGGGGGAANVAGTNGAGGGGAGGTVIALVPVTPLTRYQVSVGAAGTHGATGTNGGNSTFDAAGVNAYGAGGQGGGSGGSAVNPGTGGSGSVGTGVGWVFNGGDGEAGGTGSDGGDGGNGYGGGGLGRTVVAGAGVGGNGSLYGGGGGGGYNGSNGGDGAAGYVCIEY